MSTTDQTLAEHYATRPHVIAHDGVDCGPYTADQLVELYRADLAEATVVEINVGLRDGRRASTPAFVAHHADGRRAWVTYPGGMRHSAYYACDRHAAVPAVAFTPDVGYRGRRGEQARCADCAQGMV